MSTADLARSLTHPDDLDPLLQRIGDAPIVLLGEASHGTHEYYAWRAEITRRLVSEHGFTAVVVEGDWPDCWTVNRWVRGLDDDQAPEDPREVLRGFRRWPTWMWANTDVAQLIGWMRDRNAGRPAREQVGFYGFDVYSLWDSLDAVLRHLQTHLPDAVDSALAAVRCFEPYRQDEQGYGWSTRIVPEGCEDEVVEVLQRLAQDRAARQVGDDDETRLDAEQNAAVVDDAERYYRAMVRGGPTSWNIRDTHMVDTLDRLLAHRSGTKVVVWAHNTHVGDARATDMRDAGMVNVGQLARERHGRDAVVAVGFTGHRGRVVAADRWGDPHRAMPLPEARTGSLEDRLHAEVGRDALLVWPRTQGRHGAPDWLEDVLPHRAVGVVYDPGRERWGNYVPTVAGARYDALIALEETTALQPLPVAEVDDDVLATFPSGR